MIEFSNLKGEVLTSIDVREGNELIFFQTESGRTFRMMHYQDCCETVYVESITGRIKDMLNTPILIAEEAQSDSHEDHKCSESCTWTFYKLATVKGYLTIRWLGESNGYYSESVYFAEQE